MRARILQILQRNKLIALSVAVVTIATGLGLISTHASGFFSALEPESGQLSSPATVVNDSSASGGRALQFGSGAPTPAANVTVDFNNTLRSTPAYAFSSTISTYGEDNTSITSSAAQRTALGNIKLGLYRVPLQWNGGNIISSAGGGGTASGDSWVNNIKAFGGTPMIVIGGSSDNNFSAQDAANLVRHFNGTNGPKVSYFVVGNEPNSMGMDGYCTLFNASYDAMKAVDPTIKVAGPAWAHPFFGNFYNPAELDTFLNCAGNKVDIVDYHQYGMGESYLDNATALAQTQSYEDNVVNTRAAVNRIVPARSSQIEIQVGEYNWSARVEDGYPGKNFEGNGNPTGDDRFYQAVNTVWGASVAGHLAKAGARGHQYSDLNGALGITFEKGAAATYYGRQLNDPMPIYYGLEMFSGGNLFQHFGSNVVQATTSLPNVEVYASNNSKNVVLINKSPSTAQTAVVSLGGANIASADVWQTNKDAPFNEPAHIGAVAVTSGVAQVSLPPYSVTTMVLP